LTRSRKVAPPTSPTWRASWQVTRTIRSGSADPRSRARKSTSTVEANEAVAAPGPPPGSTAAPSGAQSAGTGRRTAAAGTAGPAPEPETGTPSPPAAPPHTSGHQPWADPGGAAGGRGSQQSSESGDRRPQSARSAGHDVSMEGIRTAHVIKDADPRSSAEHARAGSLQTRRFTGRGSMQAQVGDGQRRWGII